MASASSSSSIIITQRYSGSYTKPCTRFPALAWNPISRLALSKFKNDEFTFCAGQTRLRYDIRDTRNSFVVCAADNTPGAPPPASGQPSSSKNPLNWNIIGLFVTFILPFFSSNMSPLRVIKTKLENALQRVEDIVETVEAVAENVDKIAEDISDDLPQGKLRDLIDLVENVAEKTAKTADCLDNVIDKVQDAGEQVDDIVDAAMKQAQESKAAKAS